MKSSSTVSRISHTRTPITDAVNRVLRDFARLQQLRKIVESRPEWLQDPEVQEVLATMESP